ncbi:unnamed protein product [Paramecium primaurelia]|uniref:Uncharacterized protein n=1 Tax=Paramecium primaurelia TaxID=5886 RepID=A0A8S1KDY3_PARPR|nr:unnamed protein product [Paramecium primaurelia]
MKSLKIKTHQYFKKSEIDKNQLIATLPYCVKIESSEEDEMNDIIKLEFDRVNCIPLNEITTFIDLHLFRFTHGQIFSLIHKLLDLIEKLKYQNINQYHIWLIFNQQHNQRLELSKLSFLDYQLFYSFPLQKQDEQDKSQIIQLITKLLQLCNDIPSCFYFIESNKPYKIYEKELKQQEFQQFKQKFNDYYINPKNIDQQNQIDLNIDTKDDFVQNQNDYQKLEMFVSEYIKQNYNLSPLDTILNQLLKYNNFKIGLISIGMHADKQKKYKKYELKHLNCIFKLKSEQQLNQLISQMFQSLNEQQEILRDSIKYEDYPLSQEELQNLYESAAITYFKHQGYFNSFDQFIEITQQIIDKQFNFQDKFQYILKPFIQEHYSQIVQLNCLDKINELI